jgi:hypothetical protein
VHLHSKRDSVTAILNLNHWPDPRHPQEPLAPPLVLADKCVLFHLRSQVEGVLRSYFPNGNLLSLKASKLAAELQHPPSSLTERRGVGG